MSKESRGLFLLLIVIVVFTLLNIFRPNNIGFSVTDIFLTIGGNNDLKERIAELERENEDLKVLNFNDSIGLDKYIKVYSTYPFNDKSEITISAGKDKNFEVGDIVTSGDKILVGKIVSTGNNLSIVKTILDSNWKMPVRIGEKEIDALFTGGNDPILTLIPKDADIFPGQIIITASKDLSYGFEVGRIKKVDEVNTFKQATVEIDFNLGNLRNVKVHSLHN